MMLRLGDCQAYQVNRHYGDAQDGTLEKQDVSEQNELEMS